MHIIIAKDNVKQTIWITFIFTRISWVRFWLQRTYLSGFHPAIPSFSFPYPDPGHSLGKITKTTLSLVTSDSSWRTPRCSQARSTLGLSPGGNGWGTSHTRCKEGILAAFLNKLNWLLSMWRRSGFNPYHVLNDQALLNLSLRQSQDNLWRKFIFAASIQNLILSVTTNRTPPLGAVTCFQPGVRTPPFSAWEPWPRTCAKSQSLS